MDLKQIKELINALEKINVKKVRIKEEKGFELELEFERNVETVQQRQELHSHFTTPSPTILHRATVEEVKKEGHYITSPMVGTYYPAPSPEDPSYVKVGDLVEESTIVCIIDAMKVMNEVKAGKKGKIVEILLSNAEPVEYGTNLFRIV